MKKVSVREFQLKASDYLEELPIILTRYGKPVAAIIDVSETGYELAKKIEVKEKTLSEIASMGFCQGHFEQGVEYPLSHVIIEDVSGEVFLDKRICPTCVDKYQRQVEREGGHLEILKD